MNRARHWLWMLCLASCCAAAQQEVSTPMDVVREAGSLRGTELDGDWGEWRQGRLLPGLGLRRRFDHLLTALGEAGLEATRQWIEREVSYLHGKAAAREVLAVWERYVTLLQAPLPLPFEVMPDPAAPWVDPLKSLRREHLGAAWAEAFYGHEASGMGAWFDQHRTRHAEAAAAALLTPGPGPDAGLQARRAEVFGPEAAERLRAEDAQRWAWAERLARARIELRALAPSAQAQQAYVERHFAGSERVRAKALLGLPP